MTKLLKALLILGFASPAFADDITVDRATNIFNTEVASSSSAMRAVRVGRINTVPSVVYNQPGYAPVILDSVDGVLRYNGTSLTTATFTGTDMAVSNDLSVGRDAAVTRNTTVGGTLGVTGALSGSSGSFSTTMRVVGASQLGAAATMSTVAANGNITAGAALAAATSITAGTTVTGGTGLIATAGPVTLYPRTKAQHDAASGAYTAGSYYTCSDCGAGSSAIPVYVVSPGVMVKVSTGSW